MKKILVTQRIVLNNSYYEVREALDINWGKLLQTIGFLPIILPYNVDFKKYFKDINIDGVLLTGGNDLNSLNGNELSLKRDNIEKEIIQYAIDNNIPVLGVCRGLQIIAEFFGSEFNQISGHTNIKHTLKVNQESNYSIYLNSLGKVNSFHNYAATNLGDELLISAYSDDGIIKAVEHKKYKIFAQMWHSERENPFLENELMLIRSFYDINIKDIIDLAKKAGETIMEIYNNSVNIEQSIKHDGSIVTQADLKADNIITKGLKSISSYPLLTEEKPIEYSIRKEWDQFWLVDSLAGTKDFIAKNGEFTINIALIKERQPILGVVYLPHSDTIYYAIKGLGAYKNKKKIYNSSERTKLIGTDSNFHSTDMTINFLKKNDIDDIRRYGSSIKLCKLAEGDIDIYPRFNGTKEWDTAAGHIILNEAGCKLIDIKTNNELVYNKEKLENNFFIASRNDLEFKI